MFARQSALQPGRDLARAWRAARASAGSKVATIAKATRDRRHIAISRDGRSVLLDKERRGRSRSAAVPAVWEGSKTPRRGCVVAGELADHSRRTRSGAARKRAKAAIGKLRRSPQLPTSPLRRVSRFRVHARLENARVVLD